MYMDRMSQRDSRSGRYFSLWVSSLLCLVFLTPVFLSPAALHAQSAHTKRPESSLGPREVMDNALLRAIQSAPHAEQWPDHDYAVLLDTADVTIKPDGTVVARYRQTCKLFNTRARDLAEVNLSYNQSYQSLHVLSARTVQEDGTVLDLPHSDIHPVAQYNEYLLYDDVKGVGFSLPGIKSNCIIDYTWEEVTRPLFMPGQFWLSWTFFGPNPVECSRLTLHYPAKKPMHVALRNTAGGTPSTSTTTQAGIVTTVWEIVHAKPLPKEPMMPEWDEITPRLEISSLASWQEVAHWYWNLALPQMASSPALKAAVTHLIAGKTTPEEKARAIYEWVSHSVRYVGLEFGLSAYKPHRAADVQAKLYGDCKDKATLLIAMLGEAGIKAYPTLLHTETHNLLEQTLPTPNAFDHCIACAEVDGKEVWLDATSETCDYGDIPDTDRGAQVLLVRDGSGELKTIPDFTPGASSQEATLQVDLHPDGSARIAADLTWHGRAKQEMQDILESLSPSRRETLMKNFASQLSVGATLEKALCSENQGDAQPMTIHLECAAPHWAKRIGDLLLLPVANVFSSSYQKEFLQEKRTWPIVQGNTSSLHTQVVIALPANTIIEGMPDETKNAGPFQTFERSFQRAADGRTLTINQNYQEVPGTMPPEKYAEVKAYYAALAVWADDQIVLHVGH